MPADGRWDLARRLKGYFFSLHVSGVTNTHHQELQTCTIRYGITWSRYKSVDAESSANRVIPYSCWKGVWFLPRAVLHVLWTSVRGTLVNPGFIAASPRWSDVFILVPAACRFSPDDSCLRLASDFSPVPSLPFADTWEHGLLTSLVPCPLLRVWWNLRTPSQENTR